MVDEICRDAGRAISAQSDIRRLDQHEALIEAARRSFGRLDILINNAGVEYRGPFSTLLKPSLAIRWA